MAKTNATYHADGVFRTEPPRVLEAYNLIHEEVGQIVDPELRDDLRLVLSLIDAIVERYPDAFGMRQVGKVSE